MKRLLDVIFVEVKKIVQMAKSKQEALIIKGKYGEKVNIPVATQYVLNNYDYHFKTIWGKGTESVYAWDGKRYKPNGKEIIKTKVELLTQAHCTSKDADEVYNKIKRKTSVTREVFENIPLRYINLENGVFDLVEKKLIPHNPDKFFRTIIPVDYNPDAGCPMFLKFMEEILYPEDIPVMQEFYGFCLYREYFIKKGMICYGPKDTGKTLNLKILIKFIGEHNKCGLSLQKISSSDKFSKMALKDKFLNAYDDLSSEDLADGGGFKLATGGGYISAEEKFGESCEFRSYGKQFFCCNKIPPVKDNNDPAYFDRWIPIRFENIAENLDPFLYEKLTTPEEMSGILNWALEGLYRLLENKKFSYNRSAEQIKLIMERSGNSLSSFVQDVLIMDLNSKISKEAMFELYLEYMKDKTDFPKLSKEQLGRRLGKTATFITDKRDKERYWGNVSVNHKYQDLLKIIEEKLGKNEDKSSELFGIKDQIKTEVPLETDSIDTIFPIMRTLGKIPSVIRNFKNASNLTKNEELEIIRTCQEVD